MERTRRIAAIIIAVLMSVGSFAAVSVTTRLSRQEVRVGESFTFTLRFEGLPAPITQPFLPKIDGAEIKGQYQSAEPGKTGQAYLYHYIISPVKSGTVTLGEFTFRAENQTLKVPGFSVKVGEAPASAPARPQGENLPPPSKDDIFLEGNLARNEAYLGEAVVYTLHLMTRESVRNFEYVQKSQFDGFRKIELPSSRFPPTTKITRDAKIYLDATILKCVLYPLRSGTIDISPFQADIKVQARGDATLPTIRLKGGSTSLKVLPLPDPPQDFRGAIGTFKCEYAGTLPATGKIGEPLTADIAVKGEGSLPAEPFPVSKSSFFSSYPSTYEDRSVNPEPVTAVDRVYHLSWVPAVAGARDIPDMNFVFFDPSAKQYRKTGLRNVKVIVSDSGKAPGREIPEILPLLPIASLSRPASPVSPGTALWILAIPLVLFFLVLGISELMERFILSPGKKRLRLLTSRAVKEYRNAKSNLDARKSKVFHNHLKKSLEAVLEIRTGQPVSSLTIVELRSSLVENGTDEKEAAILTGFAEEIDACAFSNEQPQKTELIKKLEKMRGFIKQRKRKPVAALMLLMSVIALAQGQSSILTSKAADEYAKRNFSEALKYYGIVEGSGTVSAELFYNMGNCNFESGDIPRSILYYRKALKLDPSLKSARNNLSIARSLLQAKASPYQPSPLENFLMSGNADLFFYVALILLSLASLVLCWLRVFNASLARTAVFRTGIVLLLSGLVCACLFFMAIRVQRNLREGVVLEPAAVFQKPDPSLKPITTLPEGSEIFVVQSSGRWLKTKWGEGEGWTYSDKIGTP